jgi:dihydroflavonol-4-reductase
VIVVTGGTGFLGNVLLRRLAEKVAAGDGTLPSGPTRALVRKTSDTTPFAGLDIELVEGDVSDLESLVTTFRGADLVFHVAGTVSIGGEKLSRLRAVNVEGTRNVLEACRRAGVRRLVHTSSIHAFVEPPMGTCTDESTAIDPQRTHGAYGVSKAEATRLVFATAQEGLDVVVVFPTGIIGPYDFRPSHTGQFVINVVRGKMLAYVDGAYNFVDVRDVADGMIAAAGRGRSGQGYLLSGHEISVRELLDTIEELSGTPAPRLRLNLKLVRAISFLIPAYYWITRQKPLFTTYSLDVISSNCAVDNTKAKSELGFSPRQTRETLADAIAWFRQNGMA